MSIDMLRFFKMVAPESPETWFTVHHRFFLPDRADPIFPGNAHRKIRSAMDDAKFWSNKGYCVYISMGMYRNPGAMGKVLPKADRTYQNLVACKNLYLDVDVKDKDGYKTADEMKAAVKGFLEWSKLPFPTVIVGSGSGGWHVYWTLDIAIDPAEHKNLARRLVAAAVEYGLIFDRQCTVDATRLLRVAGTWNFKYADDETPATNVTLEYCGKEHVHLGLMIKGLSRWKVTPESKSTTLRVVGGTDAHGLPLNENDDLTGGMKRDYAPSDIDKVAEYCAFVKHTLATGGEGYPEPLWKYSMALAARCKEPERTAARLSCGHAGYDPVATESKLAQNHGAGPPRCETINALTTLCTGCPHLASNSSPLNVGFSGTNGSTYHGGPAALTTHGIELPTGYHYDAGNLNDYRIYQSVTDTGGAIDAVVAFEYAIIPGSAMLEGGKPFQFIFDTMQGEKQVTKRFDTTIVSDNVSFSKAFASEGLTVNIPPDRPRKFVSSYISQLQNKDETLITVPAFGWSQDKNGDMGFAFAGEFISPAGMTKCSRPEEGAINYRMMGDETVWMDLMKLIVTPDRPDLACMVAASFAAPLVGMTGESGLLIGVQSAASGIGKSTALIGGQTVWSNPRVGGLSDTVNYTFAKAGTLRHLPVFYDEIKGEKQIANMVQIAFQLTGGHEKGRSDRSGKMRKVNEFKTLCGYAANGSIVAGVREEDKGTDASWLRMFEMEGIRIPESSSDFTSKVQHLLIGLELNHGGVGKRYATYLGQNHALVYKGLAGYKAHFGQLLGANPKVERFWVGAIATTILGASIANSLGVINFPLNEMQQFMCAEFDRMRKEMAEDPSDYTKDNSLRMTIGTFLNEKQPRNMIKLDRTWTNATRPPKGYANILNEQNNWGKLEVQVSGEPLMLRISDVALSEWCLKTKRPKNILVSQMKQKLGAKMSTGMIGSGSRLAGARENVWVISAKGTIIEEDLEYGIHNKFLPP